ncbi:fasciclin domain-containing protein [Bermanella marisrubri]|uniref:Putative adhesion lipoprotein n=1 Tax=Bermanella marisrubri TaxID=207949 RepID=Q1N1C6_9GAMM|nr:fasciclin domain-containing protein [Bermanella marisrubri]EAT12124.1 putative adhesion lipoprotein [Oceanobacter sp. RED65] [Bermanella marisrubri]QIZ83587.1 fasciclin domain-containing protein [Bermanella marisrubri]
MKKLLLPLTLVSSVILAGCGSDDDDSRTTVVDVAQGDDRFTTLVTAIETAGLAATLEGDGPFTVFAPTNEAFAEYLTDNGLEATDLLAADSLADILTYHVLPVEADSTAAASIAGSESANDQLVETVYGDDVLLSLSGSDLLVNDATVVQADVQADNGVIHAIDSVLEIPEKNALSDENKTITELVVALAGAQTGAEFTVLKDAVVAAGLDDDLGGEGPFTVFAPTDAAFADLLQNAQGGPYDDLNDLVNALGLEAVTDILLQHVVSAKVNSNVVVLADGVSLATLNDEQSITIGVSNGSVTADGSNVSVTDVYASNGIIHVIDTVITTDDNPSAQ